MRFRVTNRGVQGGHRADDFQLSPKGIEGRDFQGAVEMLLDLFGRAGLGDKIDCTFFDGVDFLPGRGSLVPVYMIKSAGNVDARRFPHYVADYEFFQRIRRHGFRMGVTYKTRILAHIDETGIRPGSGPLSFSGAFQENFSKKSMRNILDHWKFIGTCAPEKYRFLLKRMLVKWMLYDFFFRTRLGSLSRPVNEWTVRSRQSLRGLWRLFEGYVIDVHSLPHPIRWPIFFYFRRRL